MKKDARVIMNAQTTLHASTESAEILAIVALEHSAQSRATDQSADVRQALTAILRSDVKRAGANQILNAHWTKHVIKNNASTHATCRILVQSMLNVIQLITELNADVHLDWKAIQGSDVSLLAASLIMIVHLTKPAWIDNASTLVSLANLVLPMLTALSFSTDLNADARKDWKVIQECTAGDLRLKHNQNAAKIQIVHQGWLASMNIVKIHAEF